MSQDRVVSLREQWEANAERWLRWARTPGHDSYDQFHGRAFLELLPPPKRLTVDLGSGEGRLRRGSTEGPRPQQTFVPNSGPDEIAR